LVRSPEEAVVTVTVVLRNTQPKPDPTSDKDVACWFQAGLSVQTELPALVDRSKLRTSLPTDPDLASSELLYRNHMVFGAGHGCAVEVDTSDVEGRRCRRVSTTFVPRQDVHRSWPASATPIVAVVHGFCTRDDVVGQLDIAQDHSSWIAASSDS
jgi:hypothetical protein